MAADLRFITPDDVETQVFAWGSRAGEPQHDADGDLLPGGLYPALSQLELFQCDNCPMASNGDQADGDDDRVGDVCDSAPTCALECSDADADGYDDCSVAGYFDPLNDGPDGAGICEAPPVIPALPSAGWVWGLGLLIALAARMARRRPPPTASC